MSSGVRYGYNTTKNLILVPVIIGVMFFLGLGFVLVPEPTGNLRWVGAAMIPLTLALAVYWGFFVTRVFIDVYPDKIVKGTISGKELTYQTAQIIRLSYNSSFAATNSGPTDIFLTFYDGKKLTIDNSIGSFEGLIEDLKAVVPPSADVRDRGALRPDLGP